MFIGNLILNIRSHAFNDDVIIVMSCHAITTSTGSNKSSKPDAFVMC